MRLAACLAGITGLLACGLTHDVDGLSSELGQGGAAISSSAVDGTTTGQGAGPTSTASVGGSGDCGFENLVCCNGPGGLFCTQPDLVCDGTNCVKCGGVSQPCCTGGDPCPGDDTDCFDNICQPCGFATVPNQPCCANNVCNTGTCEGGLCLRCCADCTGDGNLTFVNLATPMSGQSCFAAAHDKCQAIHNCGTPSADTCCNDPMNCYVAHAFLGTCQ